MNLSVIIITLGRLETLKRCVAALQRELAEGDEVIVVSASSPMVESELEKEHRNLKVVRSDRMCMPYQRNIGVRSAKHGIVAFIDDDSFVQPGWRNELLSCYGDETAASVVGRVILAGYENVRSDEPPGVTRQGRIVSLFHYTAQNVCEVELGQGGNMSFRKNALESIGLFDENYVVVSNGEETDVFIRLRRAGMKILYNPRAAVFHDAAPTVAYARSLFDRKKAFYGYRNYAYLFTKWYFPRTPFFAHTGLGGLSLGWQCAKRAAVITAHSALIFILGAAGICAGVWEGLAFRLRNRGRGQ